MVSAVSGRRLGPDFRVTVGFIYYVKGPEQQPAASAASPLASVAVNGGNVAETGSEKFC